MRPATVAEAALVTERLNAELVNVFGERVARMTFGAVEAALLDERTAILIEDDGDEYWRTVVWLREEDDYVGVAHFYGKSARWDDLYLDAIDYIARRWGDDFPIEYPNRGHALVDDVKAKVGGAVRGNRRRTTARQAREAVLRARDGVTPGNGRGLQRRP